MKRLLFILFVFLGLCSFAADYTYMTFETVDGAKVSFAAEGLSISVSGNALTIGQKTFAVSNLSKMYFSATDETSGVVALSVDDMTEDVEVYDLRGTRVYGERMKTGIYLIREKNSTFKIVVK